MAWSDIFPIFDDSYLELDYDLDVAERTAIEDHFGISAVFGALPQKHVLSASLFWKNVRTDDPAIHRPTRDMLINPQHYGLLRRYHPWNHYVRPILCSKKAVDLFSERFDLDFKLRVYLAEDLEFLVEELVEASVEVVLMKSSSISFCPGGLWRYLAFDDPDPGVTAIIDADMVAGPSLHIEASRRMLDNGLGAWRYFNGFEQNTDEGLYYRPMWGFGSGLDRAKHPRNWTKLLETFVAASVQGRFEPIADHPEFGRQPIVSSKWPDYGFDEWWMQAVLFPRACASGLLTYTSKNYANWSVIADIEYTTWANPNSTLSVVKPVHYRFEGDDVIPAATVGEPAAGGRAVPVVADPAEDFRGLAILMLAQEEVPHVDIWREYLAGAEDAKILVHAKGALPALASMPNVVEIEDRVSTCWGTASLVEAMLKLLDAALADESISHFVFVSESCVPIRPLRDLVRCLELDPRSWLAVKSYAEIFARDPGRAGRTRGVDGFDPSDFCFHPQWMLLNRNLAEVLSRHCDTGAFAKAFAPDEFAFGSVLNRCFGDLTSLVQDRDITFADWSCGGAHPKCFDHVSREDAVRIRTSSGFFARKFGRGSNIGDYGFHLS